jgi:Na+-translocating ferredoxin:NAD+ oxidoreductase RNF subunit RnfB
VNAILIATLVIGVVGILVGIALVYIGNKFHVEVDEREAAVREVLPGNNCGACGYAGCDAMAAAIISGDASPSGCPVGGAPVTAKINEIMGTSTEAAARKVAVVRCNGSCEHTAVHNNYVGIKDCRALAFSGMYPWDCDYGCMGFGSCATVCPQNAIRVVEGVAVVDPEACVGCGLCVKECPKHLIELAPYGQKTFVRCMNKDKGKDVKAACSVGCIGCRLCTKQCETGAITVEDNLARIDYSLCEDCGKCAEKCPQKTITK